MYIAIDIGGTKIAIAKYKSLEDTEYIKLEEVSTPKDYQEGFNLVSEHIARIGQWEKIDGIGIAFAGRIEHDRINLSTNLLDWMNQPFIGSLREKFQTPIKIENDAVCAALAERILGKAVGADNYLNLVMSTGMGGAYVKKTSSGYFTIPIEPEYMIVNPEIGEEREGFSVRGLLGAYATGDALQEKLGMQSLAILEDDDPTWDELTKYLCIGINNLVMMFNPETIYFSGGLIQHRPFILNKALITLQQYKEYLHIPKLEISGIKKNASLLGAKLLFNNVLLK